MSGAPSEIYAYCIRDDVSARVKIGHSRKPWNRLRQLQTGSSTKLRLVCQFLGGKYVERAFLQVNYARRVRVRGRVTEWIDDADEAVSKNFCAIASRWTPGTILCVRA